MEINLKGHAIAAGRRILRSLIRMMIKHGVMHREFVELTKEIYVEIASSDYGLRGRPTNAARMALLTGLDRKEVRRIRKKLALTQKEAGRLIGGGVNAFQKYEAGDILISSGVSNALRMLDRNPDNLNVLVEHSQMMDYA